MCVVGKTFYECFSKEQSKLSGTRKPAMQCYILSEHIIVAAAPLISGFRDFKDRKCGPVLSTSYNLKPVLAEIHTM